MDARDFEAWSGVAGALDPRAGEYAHQVDREIEALDRDVTAQMGAGPSTVNLGQAFLGGWNELVNHVPAVPNEAIGWRDYLSNLTHFQEVFSETEVEAAIGGYQQSHADFYRQFVAGGGKPSRPAPKMGFDPALAHEAEDQKPTPAWETWAKVGVGLIALFGIGYVLQGAGKLRAAKGSL